MSWASLFMAYFFSLVGGWFIAGSCIWIMHKQIGSERDFLKPLDFWIGFTERGIATTLFIWTPQFVAPFVGGWIVLKMASGWQREEGAQHRGPHLAALIGSAISFSIAISAGVIVSPDSIDLLSTTR